MQRLSFSAFIEGSSTEDLREALVRWIGTHPTRRLPSVREICQAMRISSRDVVGAFAWLRQNGHIETRQGSGSWPTGSLPPIPPIQSGTRPYTSDLAHELLERIQDGRYPTGTAVPSAKTLAREWNRHPQTISRILDGLVVAGSLEKMGRSWKVPRPRSAKTNRLGNCIVLVGASDDHGALRMDSDREVEFWRDVSLEASRNGLDTVRQPWKSGSIEVPPSALGLIVSTWHSLDVSELLQETAKTRLPVCTWLEGLKGPKDPAITGHPRLFVHEVAHSKRAGHDMAAHLIERGFRRIAWINPFQSASWSRSREEGLHTTLEAGGARFRGFGIDALTEWDFITPAWSDPDLWNQLSTTALDSLTDGRSRTIVAKAAEQLGLGRLTRSMSNALEDALAWKPDAWVASNDLVARLVKDWLTRRGAWDRTALVGFDDSSDALRQDLTSYRFDTVAMSRSMVLQILSWRKDRRTPDRISRHPGAVIARGSTSNGRPLTSG